MDKRFLDIEKRKKKAEYAYAVGTGDSGYDRGLYYLSRMVHELLSAYYYSQQNQIRFIPEAKHESHWQNEEPRFIKKVIDIFIEVTLAKFIEKKKDSWNLHQLSKEAKKLNWPDYQEIEGKISDFEQNLKSIKNNRNERYAHTAKKNRPTHLHFMIGGYKDTIVNAMRILDMFVDGEIPYKLHMGKLGEIDLRSIVVSSNPIE